MKKYFMTAISLAVVIGFLEGCEKAHLQEPISYPVPIYYTPTSEIHSVDSMDYVNEEVYDHLVNAKNNFNRLYYNGEVSSQMRNMGTSLNQGEAEYIDSSMRKIYELIYGYVDSYHRGDYQDCYQKAQNLFEMNVMEKDFLFDILVSPKLPQEFRSGIDFEQYQGIYDASGNIILKDGRLLRLIGGEDDLIKANTYPTTDYNRIVEKSEWYEKLPNLLFNEYSSIQNSNGYDGICYVWNQTVVENACRNEWASIRKEGQEIYGFDPNQVSIFWNLAEGIYYYEDLYGRVYPLTTMGNSRIDHLYQVQDAITSREGDVYFLDNYIKNMRSYHTMEEYVR